MLEVLEVLGGPHFLSPFLTFGRIATCRVGFCSKGGGKGQKSARKSPATEVAWARE